jgi:hypothetical protein
MAKIIGNKKLIWGTWGLIGYIGQFILIVSTINVYSDNDRFKQCKIDALGTDPDAQSEVYDMALRLLASYHIIEWFRMTLFLVTLLLGQNFMHVWYVMGFFNVLFGIAAYIYCHVTRYSGYGLECAEEQEYRAYMLTVEVIVFWVTFHIMSFPQAFFLCLTNDTLDQAMLTQEDDEEGEGGEGEAKE